MQTASEAHIAALVGMGFGATQAKHALLLENNNLERAADMLLTNPPAIEDEDVEMIFDDPVPVHPSGSSSPSRYRSHPYGSDSSVALLLSMGFDAKTAERCLRETGGDVQAATEKLLMTPAMDAPSQSSPRASRMRRRAQKQSLHSSNSLALDTLDDDTALAMPMVPAKDSAPSRNSSNSRSAIAPESYRTSTSAALDSTRTSTSSLSEVRTTQEAGQEVGEPKKIHTVCFQASDITFGPAAFKPLRTLSTIASVGGSANLNVKKIVEASVPGVKKMRGERDQKYVTQMLTDCYHNGLFMHGGPTSPVNTEIIPAMHYIFNELNKSPAKDAKRVSYLTELANACQDCQQVQARVILRTYGDLTAQSDTFEGQLRYTLVRQKESALDRYISRKHDDCDKDHHEVDPWKQRVHLTSGYLALIGEEFGFDGVAAALSDRFLPQVKKEIGRVDIKSLMNTLKEDMSSKEWLQTLLADINNQTSGSERLINRDCIFKWVQTNLSGEAAHLVFYDEERSDEFDDLDPKEPTAENMYQPFLGPKLLVDMLVKAGMLKRTK